MKMVGARSNVLVTIVMERLVSRHSWKLKGSHQAVHPSDTDVYAIITLKDISNFVSTKAFMVIRIDMENKLGNLLILLCSVGGFRRIMLVVSASVNAEDLAKNLDVMLKS